MAKVPGAAADRRTKQDQITAIKAAVSSRERLHVRCRRCDVEFFQWEETYTNFAKEVHSLGWRMYRPLPSEGEGYAGITCPDCLKKLYTKQSD